MTTNFAYACQAQEQQEQEKNETNEPDDMSFYFESYLKQIIERHKENKRNIQCITKKLNSELTNSNILAEDKSETIETSQFKLSYSEIDEDFDFSLKTNSGLENMMQIDSFSTISQHSFLADTSQLSTIRKLEDKWSIAEGDSVLKTVPQNQLSIEERICALVKSHSDTCLYSSSMGDRRSDHKNTDSKSNINEEEEENNTVPQKPYMKFTNNVQKALALLNNQMSSTLRASFVNIDEITSKVRQCLNEMDEHDKYYSRLRAQSTPNLIPLSSNEVNLTTKCLENSEIKEESIHIATSREVHFTPVQTQSENQVRIVLDSSALNKCTEMDWSLVNVSDRSTLTTEMAHETLKQGLKELENTLIQVNLGPYSNHPRTSKADKIKEKQILDGKTSYIKSRSKIKDKEIIEVKAKAAKSKGKVKEVIETDTLTTKSKSKVKEVSQSDPPSTKSRVKIKEVIQLDPALIKSKIKEKEMIEVKSPKSSSRSNKQQNTKKRRTQTVSEQNKEKVKAEKKQSQSIQKKHIRFKDLMDTVRKEDKKTDKKRTVREEPVQKSPIRDTRDKQEPARPTTPPIIGVAQFDISKGKPLHDIHDKLMKQIEATDSLREFQKQMRRKPAKQVVQITAEALYVPSKNINRITKKLPTTEKPSTPTKDKRKKVEKVTKQPKGSGDGIKTIKLPKTKPPHYIEPPPSPSPKPILTNKATVSNVVAPPNTPVSSEKKNCEEKYADSLWFANSSAKVKSKKDLCPHKNDSKCNCNVVVENKALSSFDKNNSPSTYKLRMQWMRTKAQPTRSHKTLNCFDLLDELTFKDVEPIQSEYPRKDVVENNPYDQVENTYLYKLVYGGGNMNNQLMELLAPSTQCATPNCNKCKPTTSVKGKPKLSEKPRTPPIKHRRMTIDRKTKSDVKAPKKSGKKQLNLTGSHVVDKLKPYLTDPHLRYPTTITVMPVRVTYTGLDELQRPPTPLTQQGGTKRKNNPIPAPPYFYTANQKRQEPAGDYEQTPRKTHKKLETQIKTKQMTSAERKLWSHKYGKSTGQHLVSFIEKQDNIEMPMYPLYEETPPIGETKKRGVSETRTKNKGNVSGKSTVANVKSTKGGTALMINNQQQPQNGVVKTKINNFKTVIPPKNISASATDSRRILRDIKTLAQKNKCLLEVNIQKVIEMIEVKIVDILSDPKKHGADAFSAVESEIMDVLKMMRNYDNAKQKPNIAIDNTHPTDDLITKLKMIHDSDNDSEVSNKKQFPIPSNEVKTIRSKTTNNLLSNNHAPTSLQATLTEVKLVTDEMTIHDLMEIERFTSSQSTVAQDVDYISSTEEKCVITAACSPGIRSEIKKENVKQNLQKQQYGGKSGRKNVTPTVTPQKSSGIAKNFTSKAGKTISKEATPPPTEATPPSEEVMTPSKEIAPTADMETLALEEEKEKLDLCDVRSDDFLTPFMQAIKNIRCNETPPVEPTNTKPSYHHIIQFLDTLTSMSEEINSMRVNCSYTVRVSFVLHQPQVYYLVSNYYPISYYGTDSCAVISNLTDAVKGAYAANLKTFVDLSKHETKITKEDLLRKKMLSFFSFCEFNSLRNASDIICYQMETEKPVMKAKTNDVALFRPLAVRNDTKTKKKNCFNMFHKNKKCSYLLTITYVLTFALIYFALAIDFSCL